MKTVKQSQILASMIITKRHTHNNSTEVKLEKLISLLNAKRHLHDLKKKRGGEKYRKIHDKSG